MSLYCLLGGINTLCVIRISSNPIKGAQTFVALEMSDEDIAVNKKVLSVLFF